jgi:hypothetical protein
VPAARATESLITLQSTPIKHDPMFHRRNDHRLLFRRAEEVNQVFGRRGAIREQHSFLVKEGSIAEMADCLSSTPGVIRPR